MSTLVRATGSTGSAGASKLADLTDVDETGATIGGVPTATQVTDPGTGSATVTGWAVKTPMNPIVAALVFGE